MSETPPPRDSWQSAIADAEAIRGADAAEHARLFEQACELAFAILVIIMAMVFTSLILGQRSVSIGMARARAEQNVNRVLSVIVPELRQSGAFFRGSDLTVPNPRTLRFRRVTGFDGTNPTWSEVVQYDLNSGSLVRSLATGPSVPPTTVFASTPTELLGGEPHDGRGNDPGLVQQPDPARAGRWRESDPLGNLLVAQARIFLKGLEDPDVEAVESHKRHGFCRSEPGNASIGVEIARSEAQ